MTVKELKKILDTRDPEAEVYFRGKDNKQMAYSEIQERPKVVEIRIFPAPWITGN